MNRPGDIYLEMDIVQRMKKKDMNAFGTHKAVDGANKCLHLAQRSNIFSCVSYSIKITFPIRYHIAGSSGKHEVKITLSSANEMG